MSDEQKENLSKAKTDLRIGLVTEQDMKNNINQKLSDKSKAKKQVNIAKDLFLTWDGDGEGSLSPEELMNAFVRIGLS